MLQPQKVNMANLLELRKAYLASAAQLPPASTRPYMVKGHELLEELFDELHVDIDYLISGSQCQGRLSWQSSELSELSLVDSSKSSSALSCLNTS